MKVTFYKEADEFTLDLLIPLIGEKDSNEGTDPIEGFCRMYFICGMNGLTRKEEREQRKEFKEEVLRKMGFL